MRTDTPARRISRLLRAIDQPTRLEILLAIGTGEACVCHLETHLGLRQAYISQHLMALRQAGILATRREGRFVFYRLDSPQIMDFIRLAAQLANIPANKIDFSDHEQPRSSCVCPQCAPLPGDGFVELRLPGVEG